MLRKRNEEIRLRFETITYGIELPEIQKLCLKGTKGEAKFKVKKKENLSNAKTHLLL